VRRVRRAVQAAAAAGDGKRPRGDHRRGARLLVAGASLLCLPRGGLCSALRVQQRALAAALEQRELLQARHVELVLLLRRRELRLGGVQLTVACTCSHAHSCIWMPWQARRVTSQALPRPRGRGPGMDAGGSGRAWWSTVDGTGAQGRRWLLQATSCCVTSTNANRQVSPHVTTQTHTTDQATSRCNRERWRGRPVEAGQVTCCVLHISWRCTPEPRAAMRHKPH